MNKIYAFIYNANNIVDNPILPDNVREHCNLYKIESKRNISLSNYHSLLVKLKEVYNLDVNKLEFTSEGKPVLDNIYISLSHSNDYYGFAISNDTNIGFDLEELIEEKRFNLSNRILNQNELEEFDNSLNKSLYLTTKWCCKEAYGKMVGTGINNDILNSNIDSFYAKCINNTIVVITSEDIGEINLYLNDVLVR